MYVYILEGRRSSTDATYNITVYASRKAAEVQCTRWERRHPQGAAEVNRYTVFGAEDAEQAADDDEQTG